MPEISFAIPAHDEELLLGRTLDSIHRSARALGRPYEIVVANDDSKDRTGEIAAEMGARVVDVSLSQISGSRNAAARASLGANLVFVDADTVLPERTLAAAVRALDEGAVGGGSTVRFDGRVTGAGRALLAIGLPLYRMTGMASGSFLFCTRYAFDAVGGFDETIYASEECWMSWALGRQGRFVVLREHVVTSGRKLRTHGTWEILRSLLRIALRGPAGLRSRDGLDIWYGPRREDPARIS